MKKIKVFGLALIVVLVYSFINLPVISFNFLSTISLLIVFLLAVGVIDMMYDDGDKTSKLSKRSFFISGCLLVYSSVVPFFLQHPLFHAKDYRALIGNVEESDFSTDISPVSVEDIRLVDEDMAMRLGDKKLGEDPALGSVAKLDKFHIQNVNGELYWVAPLVHRDVIKWLTSPDGTNGYVMVSASNPQDVRLIQELDGEPVKIVYQPEAYFMQDLKRHMYLNGVVNKGMTDFTFEIDDLGNPFWVTTLYENTIGYGGADAVGVCTVNSQTGEVNTYSISDAPSWIDRIQPENFVVEQIRDWGIYVNGFLNAVISETGVLVPTQGTSLVYGNDGRSYWYTGITSAGADESTIGFMLVDTRTKEAKLYKQPGATETAAMTSAEGKVQEKGYDATFPVTYNILGKPTYVSSLKDKAGLVKMVAFVSVEDFSVLGIGDTKEEALRSYKDALSSKGNDIDLNEYDDSISTEDTVLRISSDVIGGDTFYYMTLENEGTKIFTANARVSNQMALTVSGDKVRIDYQEESNGVCEIVSFENLLLSENIEEVPQEETTEVEEDVVTEETEEEIFEEESIEDFSEEELTDENNEMI